MIGGNDFIIPAIGDAASRGTCLQIAQRHWPSARFEDAVSGDKYTRYEEIPLGQAHEVLVYPNAAAEVAWDADSPESPPNSMLYLIASPRSITAVLDDPSAADMTVMLESMKAALEADRRSRHTELVADSPMSAASYRAAATSAKTKDQV